MSRRRAKGKAASLRLLPLHGLRRLSLRRPARSAGTSRCRTDHAGQGGVLSVVSQHRFARYGRPVPRMVIGRRKAVHLRNGGDILGPAQGIPKMSPRKRNGKSPRTGETQKDIALRTTQDLWAVSGRNLANLAPCRQRQAKHGRTRQPERIRSFVIFG